MRTGASIGGMVRNPYGADLSGASVVVRGWNTGTVRRTVSSYGGHYWVHGLPSDDYSVQVNAHDESLDSWLALEDQSWGFHRDPGSAAERTYVRVSHEAAGRPETVVDGIDGAATEGVTLTGIFNPQLDTDFTNATVHVYGESIGSTFDTHVLYWSPGRRPEPLDLVLEHPLTPMEALRSRSASIARAHRSVIPLRCPRRVR